jgi:hypothetical protein
MPEIVYVLTNEAMEGMVKIGRTTTSVEQRIRELDNTSMPLPFQCFYAAEVGNSLLVEGKLHRIFSDKRIRSNREFFRADANQVKEAIQLLKGEGPEDMKELVLKLGMEIVRLAGVAGSTLSAKQTVERHLTDGSALEKLKASLFQRLGELTSYPTDVPLSTLKVKALVLNLIHNMDVVDQLLKAGTTSPKDWQWRKQLRYYLNQNSAVTMRMVSAEFD